MVGCTFWREKGIGLSSHYQKEITMDDKMVVAYNQQHEVVFISLPMPQTSADILSGLLKDNETSTIIVNEDEGRELKRQREAA